MLTFQTIDRQLFLFLWNIPNTIFQALMTANQNSSTTSNGPPQLELDEKDREDSLMSDMDATINDPTPMSGNQNRSTTPGGPPQLEDSLLMTTDDSTQFLPSPPHPPPEAPWRPYLQTEVWRPSEDWPLANTAAQYSAQSNNEHQKKVFPLMLDKMEEFPIDWGKKLNSEPEPYVYPIIERICGKTISTINVRPYVYDDLVIPLPEFAKQFYQECSLEVISLRLQGHGHVFSMGNMGHQRVLKAAGMCELYDPVPLIFGKDVKFCKVQKAFVNTIS